MVGASFMYCGFSDGCCGWSLFLLPFTNSFKSSSQLLVGLPPFLRVLVEMMSPGVPLGSSSGPLFFTLWQFAWLDAIS